MKTLLTHGYFLDEDQKESKIMRPYPPLGLLCISAYLEQKGIDNDVYDTTFSNKAALFDFLLRYRPKYLGVYVNLMTKVNVLETIRFVRQSEALKDTVIILGGQEVRNSDSRFLENGADYVILGEGEETCLELIQSLEQGTGSPEQIPGLALRKEDHIIRTQERTQIREIDHLPIPNRHKIDLSKYLNAWTEFHGINAISVSTMRGCPYTCKWCSRAVYGLSYRRRSPANVVRELRQIEEQYQPDTIWFVDDVFTISHKWLSGFREELAKENLQISYECITRSDRLNEEVISTLKDTGCFRVWIGAESGSQKIIDLMDRRVKVEQVREMIQLAKRKGMQAGTFVMLGYPGETEQDIKETIRHLKISNPDHFTITLAYPIRGTELYDEIVPVMQNHLDWSTTSDRQIEFKRTYSRRYYDFAVSRVNNEVNYHRSRGNSFLSVNSAKYKLKSIAAKAGMTIYRILAL